MQKQAINIREEKEEEAEYSHHESVPKQMQAVQGGGGGGKQAQSNASTRRLSAGSQDFEFNKLGEMVSSYINVTDDHHQPLLQAGVLASADELFYKGQLLPLQYKNHHHLHRPADSPSHSCIELPFEPLSPQLHIISRDQADVRFSSSCRMNNVSQLGLDSSLFHDFTRSSSFRSHSSKYSSYYCNYYASYGTSSSNCSTAAANPCWDDSTATSTGGESSGSCSRDSNGSSQDSACSSSSDINHREHHHVCCHGHNLQSQLMYGPHCPRRKQGFMQSWRRLLLNGLKRGAAATNDHIQVQSTSRNIHGGLQRITSLGKIQITASNEGSLACNEGSLAGNNQGSSSSLSCGCKLQECRRGSKRFQLKSSEGIRKESKADHHQQGPNYICSEIKRGSRAYSPSINGSASKSSKWNSGYTRRIKPISLIKARLMGNYGKHNMMINTGGTQIGPGRCNIEEDSRDKRRVTRKLSLQPSLCNSSVKGISINFQVPFRFHATGAVSSSSCPASVRSSPNHSGLLCPDPTSMTMTTTMSTMQELHSAVQGAIAHCKQSNAHVLHSQYTQPS